MTKPDNNSETTCKPVIDLHLPIREIGRSGWQALHELTAEQRGQLADELGLMAITSFKTRLNITPGSGGKFHLKAGITAAISQQSSISLQPVTKTIEEEFHLTFAPAVEEAAAELGEIELTLEDETPEIYHGDSLDLGQLIYEHFAISLEQYPKNEGETFVWDNQQDQPDESAENPFAVLKTLADKPKGQ